jgi:hypothetical protein
MLLDPTGTVTATDAATVNGNGTYTALLGFGSGLPPATYQWVATYSGDANNATSTGATEPVTVRQTSPTLSTNPTPVTLGPTSVALSDMAVLEDGLGPTGTITLHAVPQRWQNGGGH